MERDFFLEVEVERQGHESLYKGEGGANKKQGGRVFLVGEMPKRRRVHLEGGAIFWSLHGTSFPQAGRESFLVGEKCSNTAFNIVDFR